MTYHCKIASCYEKICDLALGANVWPEVVGFALSLWLNRISDCL